MRVCGGTGLIPSPGSPHPHLPLRPPRDPELETPLLSCGFEALPLIITDSSNGGLSPVTSFFVSVVVFLKFDCSQGRREKSGGGGTTFFSPLLWFLQCVDDCHGRKRRTQLTGPSHRMKLCFYPESQLRIPHIYLPPHKALFTGEFKGPQLSF